MVTSSLTDEDGSGPFQELFESSLVGHIVMHDFRPLLANAAMARMTGFKTVEALLQEETVLPFLVEPSPALIQETFEQARRSPSAILTARAVIRSRSGALTQAVCTIQHIQFNGAPADHVVVFDVSAQAAAEAALRESEKRLTEAQAIARMGGWQFEIGKGPVYWSDGMFRIFEMDPQPEPPPVEQMLSLIHEQDRLTIGRQLGDLYQDEQARAAMLNRFAHEGDIVMSLRLRFPDGRIKHLEVVTRILNRDDAGAIKTVGGVVRDVSEETAMQHRLRETEYRYQDLFESDCVGHVIWQDDVPVRANAQALALFGYHNESALLSDPAILLGRVEAGQPMLAHVSDRLGQEGAENVQHRWRAHIPDGDDIWVDSRFRMTRWQGAPAIRETLFDVTAEVAYARKLKASEERYELVVAGAQTGIFEWNVETREGYISIAGLSLLGLKGDPYKSFRDLNHNLHPEDAERFLLAIRSDIPRGEEPFRFRQADGTYRHMRATWVNAGEHGGDPAIRVGSFQDVTMETEAREALKRSEQRNSMVIENAQVGIFDWNTDPEVGSGYISPLGQQLLGLNPVEGRGYRDIDPGIHPDDATDFFKHVLSDDPGGAGVYRFLKKGEGYRSYRMQWINAGPVTGEIYRRVGSFRDVTQELQLAEERLQLEYVLRQSQKMEALGQMAGGIAHEIGNLIQPILLLSKQIHQEADLETIRSYNADIAEAASKAAEISREILAFARPEARDVRPVRFDTALKQAVALAKRIVPATMTLRVQIPVLTGYALVSETALSQVMLNLIANAVDAQDLSRNPSGLITVSLGAAEVDARHAAAFSLPAGLYFQVIVEDQGMGMGESIREKIFEPFFTTKGPGKGTGLGLAIVHAIVAAWNGAVTVDSAPDEGTCFRVFVPFAQVGMDLDDRRRDEIAGPSVTL